MTTPGNSGSTRLLQISDTHFVSKLTTRGGRLGRRAIGTPSHDFAKVTALGATLTRLGLEPFDHLVVTGDVSTDGSQAALELARSYIERDVIEDSISKRLILYGLDSRDKCTVLPGNHDRYRGALPLQRRSRRFEHVFEDAAYPYVKILNAPRPGAPTIALFVFDSTQTLRLKEKVFSKDRLPARIARGEVSGAECQFLLKESQKLSQNPGSTPMVKIALLHHHPVPPPESDRLGDLKSMDNSHTFVDACLEAGMNMVLFGHQHVAYARTITSDTHKTHFLCCPSTFEYTVKVPGFYLHTISPTSASVQHYYWEGTGFTASPQQYDFGFV